MTSKQMRDVLQDAIGGNEPPPRGGADEVFAKAGRLVARQRLTVGASAIGVVAIVALVAANVGFGQKPETVLQPAALASPSAAVPAAPTSLLAILTGLLPSGTVVTEKGETSGFAWATLEDSKGETTVWVNVQQYEQAKPGANDSNIFDCATRSVPKKSNCKQDTLADAVAIVLVDGPVGGIQTDKDVVQRCVDILYSDDRRVAITVFNAKDIKRGHETRPVPALSLEQIRAIARAAAWREIPAAELGGQTPGSQPDFKVSAGK